MEETSSNNGSPKAPKNLIFEKKSVPSELDARSAEVQEIIGRPPHWLIRMGIAAFFGVLAMVLIAASFIKYPETITAPLKLTAINAPKSVVSKINGKLIRLNVENGTSVKKGQVLAWLESTASHNAVLKLSARIDSLHKWRLNKNFQKFNKAWISNFTGLGELQIHFQTFVQHYHEFISYLPRGFFYQKRQILKQEMEYYRSLLQKLKEQKKIKEEVYKIAEQEFNMQKELALKELIAPMQFSKQKSELLASRLPLQQIEAAIISNHVLQVAKKKKLMELNRQIDEQKMIILQALNTLKSAIDEWKEKHLLIAPVAGKLIYSGIIQENETIKGGQEVFFIQPHNTHFFGEMFVSQHSFGKIQEEQKVLVRFNGYPSSEYGSVLGKIEYFSEFPVRDSSFIAKISFPKGLVTNYGQKLPPTNGMTGQAEIITQDMRLLERFYNNITEQIR